MNESTPTITLVQKPDEKRVDVLVENEPFTSYIYPSTIKKPVLYPLRTAKGTLVTRGFPLDPRPRERVDHPHHVGTWFNYGDVNGVDFWNNSDAIPADKAHKMGTIFHTAVLSSQSGKGLGSLKVSADWKLFDQSTILKEETQFNFRASSDIRIIDRITVLRALDKPVVFTDNKEGVFAIRVARQLEHPSTKAELFTDASGKPTNVPVMDNTGVNGMYLSSEGKKGDDVWATRGRWVILTGRVEAEDVTLGILDHPTNPGYPTYWHARGYGLFSANPLGQKSFSNGKEVLNFTLQPGNSAKFQYRILIASGALQPGEIENRYENFLQELK